MLELSPQQNNALEQMMSFIFNDEHDVFVLRGGAGSGKTSVIARLAYELNLLDVNYQIMAPTGKASRVLSNKLKANFPADDAAPKASTTHSAIYEFSHQEVNRDGLTSTLFFQLKEEKTDARVLIVDEASMLGNVNHGRGSVVFGSGKLLSDLLVYAKSTLKQGKVKIILIGDDAQLLPVKELLSPALSPRYLSNKLGLRVQNMELTSVFRQSEQSLILKNALSIRKQLMEEGAYNINLKANDDDVFAVEQSQIAKQFSALYQQEGSCIIVCHTNQQVAFYNQAVRRCLWGYSSQLQVGDRLVVQQNNPCHHYLNGDLLKVLSVADEPEIHWVNVRRYGPVELRFRKVQLVEEDSKSIEGSEAMILESLLESNSPTMSHAEKIALEVFFNQRHKDLDRKSMDYQIQRSMDKYLNVLEVKYGYAVTCHKSQGGEWAHVFVDMHYKAMQFNEAHLRWAYTAITRASDKLYLANALIDYGEALSFRYEAAF